MSADDKSAGVLCQEILTESRLRGEEIVRRAREQAQALLARARAEAETARGECLSQCRAEAAGRRELLLAAVPVEIGRRRAARIEALLQSVRDEVLRRLLEREGFDYRQTLVALAAEAVRQMAGEVFVVSLSPEDHASFRAGLAEDIARRAGRSPLRITLAEDAEVTGGGLVVRDAEGRQVWDDRLPVRLARLWPDLRRQIAVQAGLVDGGTP
jgi:vacuolar-type H+-ATPase subunit E/Vma4